MSFPKTKRAGKLVLGHWRAKLAEVRNRATFAGASFGKSGLVRSDEYPTSEEDVTPFIADRTRPHREAYLVMPLDEIIGQIDEMLAGIGGGTTGRDT